MNQEGVGAVEAVTRGNLSLANLPEDVLRQFTDKSFSVALDREEVLSSGRKPNWIYFLEEGLASIIRRDDSGSVLETGMVGREGVIGGQNLFGLPQSQSEVRMLVGGVARRIEAEVLKTIAKGGELDRVLTVASFALYEQTSQNVLCNRHHELESRLARWLLQVSDFTRSRVLFFKHSFLAEVLGVTRSAVTISAGCLLDDGMITYSRGEITILDRKKLTNVACNCYQVIRKLYKQIYPTLF